MQARSRGIAAVIALLLATTPALAAAPADPLAGTIRQEGLLPVHVDKAGGRILLQLPAPGPDGVSARLLYMAQLRTGLGSAPLGLDRSRPGPANILSIRRLGKKVAFELENPRFRATDAPAPEQAAARDAFATSTPDRPGIWTSMSTKSKVCSFTASTARSPFATSVGCIPRRMSMSLITF